MLVVRRCERNENNASSGDGELWNSEAGDFAQQNVVTNCPVTAFGCPAPPFSTAVNTCGL